MKLRTDFLPKPWAADAALFDGRLAETLCSKGQSVTAATVAERGGVWWVRQSARKVARSAVCKDASKR